MLDIRDLLFRDIAKKKYRVVLTAERAGVLAGTQAAYECANRLGIALELCKKDGEDLSHEECFGNFVGTPKQIALAEEQLIGTLAKASGIAKAAREAVLLADGRVEIVAGAWKKMPPEIKAVVRDAIVAGGASFRICQPPMLYLDKNFIRMFGSIARTLDACKSLPGAEIIVQLRGDRTPLEQEVQEAADGGCTIFMVDTGEISDLRRCIKELQRRGIRENVKVAYAGNVKRTDILELADCGADILCIGKEIVDAGLLDIKLDVLGEEDGNGIEFA